ncbi:uncharacterized protein LOC114737243 [Neltuma alba]|uniref:uncharacterized protein LOC114737243 n=1 Tax=Neltuma alba TaxID=207710 RepID=UPI0010A34E11|nr:uncharacterized protein LOC114737243 [Prosopis alba]
MVFQSQVPRNQLPKLNFLRLYELDDAQATSPYWFLQNISSLEWLFIQDYSFKVIFPEERPRDENGEIEIKTQIKKLTLYKLNELQHICREGCQLDPVLDVLEYLDVDKCSNLKHLVPSSVTLNHLTHLEVQNCSGLMYLITSATARSLVKLTTLKIIECDSVELIVAEEEGESRNEIAFNSLEVLELDSLSKLQMFCSSNYSMKLPLLEKLVIRRCPRMTSFSGRETSAPMLRKILTDEQEGIWCWEGDLTRTVSKMFQDMSASTSGALSYEEDGAESKANEIDNSGKQEIRKHTIPHTGSSNYAKPSSPARTFASASKEVDFNRPLHSQIAAIEENRDGGKV